MFCNQCGQKLNDGAGFCFKCGHSIVGKRLKKVSINQLPEKKQAVESNSEFLLFLKKIPLYFNKHSVVLIAVLVVLFAILLGGIFSFNIFKLYKAHQEEARLSQEKLNSQLEQTQKAFQETQGELKDVQSQIGEQNSKQANELSETKNELSSLKDKNNGLKNLIISSQKSSSAAVSLFPQSTSDFVSKNGKYVVKIVCADSSNNVDIGSGVILGKTTNNKTLIITNNHAIPASYTQSLDYPCIVFYSDNPTVNLTKYYYAQPVYFASRASNNTMSTYDFNYLELRQEVSLSGSTVVPIPNTSLIIADGGRPKVCSAGNIQVGNKVLVLGYAGVGGSNLTAKEGIISGFDNVYTSTSAKIEQGDSGGGAFLPDSDCLIGMPTYSVSGRIESLGRILMLSYISNYIIQLSELGN